jgi:ASC-1-like (ASCH) protein
VSSAQFQIIFDGPAVSGGEIDVRELTASLAAMNVLFEEADTLLNDGRTRHALKVKGSFKTGSFKVMFASQQSAIDTAMGWLNTPQIGAITNAESLLALLLVGGGSLIGVLKWLKGRKVTKIIQTDDKRFAVYSGDQFIEAEDRVIQLFNDFKVRRAFEAAIAEPLKEGKIETIAITDDKGKTFVEATVAEKSYFGAIPDQQAPLPSYTYETNVSLVRLSFKEANKWAVFDGKNTISVNVEDEDFLRRIDQSDVSFSKGDILHVKMRIDQSETSTGLKTEHTIEKVIEHRPPMYRGQLRLNVDPGESQNS